MPPRTSIARRAVERLALQPARHAPHEGVGVQAAGLGLYLDRLGEGARGGMGREAEAGAAAVRSPAFAAGSQARQREGERPARVRAVHPHPRSSETATANSNAAQRRDRHARNPRNRVRLRVPTVTLGVRPSTAGVRDTTTLAVAGSGLGDPKPSRVTLREGRRSARARSAMMPRPPKATTGARGLLAALLLLGQLACGDRPQHTVGRLRGPSPAQSEPRRHGGRCR